MTAKWNMDVYLGHNVYIFAANFIKIDGNLPKHQKVDKFWSVLEEKVHIKDDQYTWPSDTQANLSDNLVNVLYLRRTSDRFGQLAEYKTVKKTVKKKL